MTDSITTRLADELTTGFAAVPGVRAVFPAHAAIAAVLALVRGTPEATGRVRVSTSGASVVISARLATERAVPTRAVLADAVAVVDGLVGDRPYELELEIAVID